MTVRPVRLEKATGRVHPDDAATVAAFYHERGGTGPAREMLPAHGFMAEDEHGKPLACAFCYLDGTGSGVAHLAWVASAPHASPRLRGLAVKAVIDLAIRSAEALNYWLIMATFPTESLVKTLRARGFKVGDTNSTHLYLQIKWD